MERPYWSNAEVNEKCVSRKLWMEEKEDLRAKPYFCSFCRREFRSAQALGGHMNIHRRDRARLKILPSWISEKPYTHPNPNPNFSSPTSSASLLNFSSKNHSYASSSASLLSFSGPLETDLAKRKSFIGEAKGLAGETEFDQVLEKEKIISLDLKKETFKNPSGYVDLELRLGYL